jgi:hypothetical protein
MGHYPTSKWKGSRTMLLTKEIVIEVRDVYGHEKYYPACDASKIFAKLTRTITLTPAAINDIKKLGYEVKTKQREI